MRSDKFLSRHRRERAANGGDFRGAYNNATLIGAKGCITGSQRHGYGAYISQDQRCAGIGGAHEPECRLRCCDKIGLNQTGH